jgi:lipopolysaccharide export system permease protein
MFRTILWELVRVFLMSLIGITGMLLMAGIISEATQHGLSPLQLLEAIPLLIPSTLPYTLPATTLFATCVVYGRLAHDNEILAIKAAGINIISVVWPAISLGVSMSAVTLYLYWAVIPTTHYWMRGIVLQDPEEFLYKVLKNEHCLKKIDFTMSVREVKGRTLYDVVIVRFDPKTHKPDLTARAEEAQMYLDMTKKKQQLKLHGNRWVIVSPTGDNGNNKSRDWYVDLPEDFGGAGKKFRTGDMTWMELNETYANMEKEKEEANAQLDAAQFSRVNTGPGSDGDRAMEHLRYLSKQKAQDMRGVLAEIIMRPALGIGCLCFVIIGCPIGIWFSKSDYLSAFITCFLPIVTLYYPILLCGSNMAKSGKIPAAPAIWCADFMMMLVAVPLYRKLMKN